MRLIDDFLNNITMYRLMLYCLIILVAVAAVFSLFGILPYNFFAFIFSVGFLIIICYLTNGVFAKTFDAIPNVESVYISALILALIISPANSFHDLIFLGWAAVWAMASKYIFAIGKKHIFNPAAFAVTLTAYTINQSATWWVGNLPMLPFVLAGGILIVRKIRRFDLVATFMLTAIAVILGASFLKGNDLILVLQKAIFYSPLLFFAFVMLTEPLTAPGTKRLQVFYGALVGFLFAPQVHLGSFYTTPEISLLIGNIFSYLVSSKERLVLKLKEKIQIASGIYDFVFVPNKKIAFLPGQYMEWTLGHLHPDSRGNRRYFTLASSPSEDNLRIGVKFYETSSSFKKSLLNANDETRIIASQLTGDFVLPENPDVKCVFIAGGIGITPFRSMIKYLLDKRQKRSIILFYANRNASEIVYADIFDKAQEELGIKTVYTLTDKNSLPSGWTGRVGHIDAQAISEEVPDYKERVFYLSGPHSMVATFERVLVAIGLKKGQIKTDFFPGYA
jgi:ferredoxin-NADP reductase/Na+-translocating ferredoxin:NAD+ oxidoreductase RnfD subunit